IGRVNFSDRLATIRYIMSLLSVVFILLQATLPVFVAAEEFIESDAAVSETTEAPEETGLDVIIEPVTETQEEAVEIESAEIESSEEIIESVSVPESLPVEKEEVVNEPAKPALLDFKVSIVWQDGNNVDALRPELLTIYRLDNKVNQNNS